MAFMFASRANRALTCLHTRCVNQGFGLLQHDLIPEFLLNMFSYSAHGYTRGTWSTPEECHFTTTYVFLILFLLHVLCMRILQRNLRGLASHCSL